MSNIEKDNTRFVHGQQQATQEMIGQQDVALDSLGNAVDRLEGMGRTINTELKGKHHRHWRQTMIWNIDLDTGIEWR